jgi:uncharacterized protein YwgA
MRQSDLANSMATIISLVDAAGEVRGQKTFQTMVYLLQHVDSSMRRYRFRFVPDYPRSEEFTSDLVMLVASGLVNETSSNSGDDNKDSGPVLRYSLNRAGRLFLEEFEHMYKMPVLQDSVKRNMEQIAKWNAPRLRRVCRFVRRYEIAKTGKKPKSNTKVQLHKFMREAGILTR